MPETRIPENNALFAVAFDPDTLEVSGGHVPLVEGVGRYYAVSDSGNLIYIPQATSASVSLPTTQCTLVWVDREGNEEPLAAGPNLYHFCKISPDGKKVALAIGPAANHDIWIMDLIRETKSRLTFDGADDFVPLWTPDGQRIVFYSNRGTGGIYWKAANSTFLYHALPEMWPALIARTHAENAKIP